MKLKPPTQPSRPAFFHLLALASLLISPRARSDDAFYRGLGLDPPTLPQDPAAEMEALGQRFRLLVEGMMLMLRTRAKEKQNARVAQTVTIFP